MDTYDEAMLAVFRNFIRQALGVGRGGFKVVDCRLYAHPRLPGAVLGQFDLEGDKPSQVIGFLPAPGNRDPGIKALFDEAMDAPQSLKLIEKLGAVRDALNLLLSAIDCRIEGGTLKFTKMLTEAEVRSALEDAESAQVSCGVAGGDEINFRALALEILSGAPHLHFEHTDGAEGFEVYAFKHDPFGTLLVRSFDHGTAFVVAVATSHEGAENTEFHAACRELVKGRLSRSGTEGPVPEGLQRLDLVQALERLGRLLGQELAHGLALSEPQIFGALSAEALERLDEISSHDPLLAEPAVAEDEPFPNLFEMALYTLKELKGDPIWSEEAEANDEPRIEVLTHIEHPLATILVNRLPYHPKVAGAWSIYSPDVDSETMSAIRRDLERMLIERRIFSDVASPLTSEYPFRHVPERLVKQRLEEVNAATLRNEGYLCEELISRAANAPRPSSSSFCIPFAERDVLH